MTAKRRASLTAASLAYVAIACACSRSISAPTDQTTAPATSAVARSSASPLASTSASAKPSATRSFKGTYMSEASAMYVPDGGEWSGVKYRGDDASDGLGAGTISITVSAASGRVEGSLDGALGAMTVSGFVTDGDLTATLSRKNEGDNGFYGTLLGKIDGASTTGTMHLSLANANVIRRAKFTATESK